MANIQPPCTAEPPPPREEEVGHDVSHAQTKAETSTGKRLLHCRSIAPDIVIVSALLIAGWKFTRGIREVVDIGLWDETQYLTQGIDFLRFALPSPDSTPLYAPLYAIWYSLLARVSPDAIALYYLSYSMVTALPPVLFYILLRRYRVSLISSSILATFLLITGANFSVYPKVMHFELMVLLTFLILAAIPKSWTLGFAVLAFGCLVASYVRPEMYYGFGLCFAVSVALFIFRERTRPHATALASLALIAVAAGLFVGFPLSSRDRSFDAFAQHFSLNWHAWTNDTSASPWEDWPRVVETNFGQASSIGQAAANNPAAFTHHLETNALNLPGVLVSTFALHPTTAVTPVPLPTGFLPFHMRPFEAYVLVALGIIALLWGRKTILPRLRVAMRTERRYLLFSCTLLPVFILTCLIIYPRPHYIFALGTLLLALSAILLGPFKERQMGGPSEFGAHPPDQRHQPRGFFRIFPAQIIKVLRAVPQRWYLAVFIALVIVVVTPNVVRLVRSPGQSTYPRPALEAIQFINSLDITAEAHLLSEQFGYTSYLGQNFGTPCSNLGCGNWRAVLVSEKNRPFDSFRRERKINMILVTEELQWSIYFRDDQEWKKFEKTFESVGFVKLVLPDGKRVLYVDRSILPSVK